MICKNKLYGERITTWTCFTIWTPQFPILTSKLTYRSQRSWTRYKMLQGYKATHPVRLGNSNLTSRGLILRPNANWSKPNILSLKKFNILNTTFYITWSLFKYVFVLLTGSFLLNIFWEINLNEILINERERFKKLEKKGDIVCFIYILFLGYSVVVSFACGKIVNGL